MAALVGKRGKICLTEEAIYFANDGRAFSREGLMALSLAFVSPKNPKNKLGDPSLLTKDNMEWVGARYMGGEHFMLL